MPLFSKKTMISSLILKKINKKNTILHGKYLPDLTITRKRSKQYKLSPESHGMSCTACQKQEEPSDFHGCKHTN